MIIGYLDPCGLEPGAPPKESENKSSENKAGPNKEHRARGKTPFKIAFDHKWAAPCCTQLQDLNVERRCFSSCPCPAPVFLRSPQSPRARLPIASTNCMLVTTIAGTTVTAMVTANTLNDSSSGYVHCYSCYKYHCNNSGIGSVTAVAHFAPRSPKGLIRPIHCHDRRGASNGARINTCALYRLDLGSRKALMRSSGHPGRSHGNPSPDPTGCSAW